MHPESSELLQIYTHLHSRPELSMAEFETSGYLRAKLSDLGAEVVPFGPTGFAAIIRNGTGRVVAFRADMDGLPVREQTGLDFASTVVVKGVDGVDTPVMHACGHDVHMTVAVGLAQHLLDDRDGWAGTVVIVFQSGEETGQGARQLLEHGLWDQLPQPECLFGLHVWPIPAGTVELTSGDTMAMGDSFEVTFRGVGGHGSQPQNAVDPIVVAAHAVVALQSVVSRNISPLEAGVVTVGTFHAGTKENVIPSEATITLNVRSVDPAQRQTMLASIRRIVEGAASTYGAEPPRFRDINAFPRLYSDPDLVTRLSGLFRAELGAERVADGRIKMASEDFGLLAQALGVPCAYWFVGGLDPAVCDGGRAPQNHSPFFAPDPVPTLDTGVRSAVVACYSVVGTSQAAQRATPNQHNTTQGGI